MPVRNEERFILQAVRSVQAQTLEDFELIVVDDSSTDKTPDIAGEICRDDPRCRLLHSPGTGTVAAVNAGFSASRGRAIRLLAGDDLLPLNSLEATMTRLPVGGGSVYHDFTWIDERGMAGASISLGGHLSGASLNEVVKKHLSVPGGFVVMSRSVASCVFPLPETMRAEDQGLGMALKAIARVEYLPEPMYHYRRHPQQTFGNVSHSNLATYSRRLRDFSIASRHYREHLSLDRALEPDALRQLRSREVLADMIGRGFCWDVSEWRRLTLRDSAIAALASCGPWVWDPCWRAIRELRALAKRAKRHPA